MGLGDRCRSFPADNILTKFEISPEKIKVAILNELTGVTNCCWMAGAQCGADWRDLVWGLWFGCRQGETMTGALLVIWEFPMLFLICKRCSQTLHSFHLVLSVLDGHPISNVKAGFWLVDYFVGFWRERRINSLILHSLLLCQLEL